MPWMEEPGRLPCMGLHRVRQNRSDLAADSILKSRNITLSTKIHLVKTMVFPVVMYGCESWTIKKSECQRINAFELWCWRRLLIVPWTIRGSNQSILKISPEYSMEGLILKLKLQCFGHLMGELTHWKRPWCWERLKMGREGDDRGWDGWMASLTRWIWVWVAPRVGDGEGRLVCCSPWGCKELDMTDWTELRADQKGFLEEVVL